MQNQKNKIVVAIKLLNGSKEIFLKYDPKVNGSFKEEELYP
jgi:hypothetical protein